MPTCQICQHEIWEDRWPEEKGDVKAYICLHCHEALKQHRRGHRLERKKETGLGVCERCGEASSEIEETDAGRLCSDCSEDA